MKIVVLDADPALGSASNGNVLGAISDEPLRALGSLELYPRTRQEQVLERCQGAEVVLSNKVVLGESEFANLPCLKLVSVLATGVNVIDTRAAARRGIWVCNVPGYSSVSTAQHAFALILQLCNQVGLHDRSVHEGSWVASPSFSYFRAPLVELEGLTLGIFGLGAIGTQMARLGQAFGMRVISFTRTPKNIAGIAEVSKDEVFERSDVLSLHCPLTEETRHLVDEAALSLMKPSAFLINCARGPLVDEAALARALSTNRIRGAATDVLSKEPPTSDNPLLSAPRCIITPHIAWATEAARRRLIQISADNVAAYVAGCPQNVVAEPISNS